MSYIFERESKALPKKLDSIDSGTLLSRLVTPNPLLTRPMIPVELFKLSAPHFLLKRKLEIYSTSEGKGLTKSLAPRNDHI